MLLINPSWRRKVCVCGWGRGGWQLQQVYCAPVIMLSLQRACGSQISRLFLSEKAVQSLRGRRRERRRTGLRRVSQIADYSAKYRIFWVRQSRKVRSHQESKQKCIISTLRMLQMVQRRTRHTLSERHIGDVAEAALACLPTLLSAC